MSRRSAYCGELRLKDEGKEVILMGWVNKRRDHGGLIFIDLRDRSGIIQVVLSPEVNEEAFHLGEKVRSEYVLAAKGKVSRRPAGTENENLATGEIEVYAEELEILNPSKVPPFYPEDELDIDEALRLKYRYIDLRRPAMYRSLLMRHTTNYAIRRFLNERGFLEIETPLLTKSTPEGARDYLVPSRIHRGSFYALPQSPQLFKQILMVAGMEKYYQIARCFRDEDLRADRQPEFTQLDLEMSFIEEEDILNLTEEMLAFVFKEALGLEISLPFPRLSYEEALSRFGSDKPDLRFGLELKDVSEIVASSSFKVFQDALLKGGEVRGFNAKGLGSYSRKELDDLTKEAIDYGAKGLAWFQVTKEGELKSPIVKFFTAEELENLKKALAAEPNDLLLFVADEKMVAREVLGRLRLLLAQRLGLMDTSVFSFCWVTDWPLFEYDEEEKRYVALHHPFTSPKEEDIDLMDIDPLKVKARAYDVVLNGVEIGGGSIRIHRRELEEKMFKLLNMSKEESEEKFGFLLEAFDYGAPPHGGIALGLDRLLMLMLGLDTIRDVIAFPKTQSAYDPLTGAPAAVTEEQLRELGLKLDLKERVVLKK